MNFVSEKEIQEQRANKIEPEEEVDNRPLYYRLKEQRDKKQLEFDEAHKLKNQFRGIDDDEAEFLRMVDNNKQESLSKQKMEEEELIKKTLERQTASVPSTSNVLPIKPTKPAGGGGNQPKSKQASLISVGVRKRPLEQESSADDDGQSGRNLVAKKISPICQVVGVLPGMASYNDSSENDDDDSDENVESPEILQNKVILYPVDDDSNNSDSSNDGIVGVSYLVKPVCQKSGEDGDGAKSGECQNSSTKNG